MNEWINEWITCVDAKSLQSCLTLCDPMDCSPPGSSVYGILQARILECIGVAISFSRQSSPPRDQTCLLFLLHCWLLYLKILFHSFVAVVQSLNCFWFFATPSTAARQAALSSTISQRLLKFMSIKSVMPFNHLILCCPHLLWPSIFPIIRVFSNELVLRIRWPKYWSLRSFALAQIFHSWLPSSSLIS